VSEPVEASGTTVEEAIDTALERLGATEDEVEIRILSEGGPKGILSRKVEPARVLVRLRDERTPEDLAAEVAEDEESGVDLAGSASPELKEQAAVAEDFLRGLLGAIGLEGHVTSEVRASSALVEITGPEMGLLIGRYGATLEALQDVTRAAVQRHAAVRPQVNLDVEGYRARQRARLERKAREVAAKVRQSRRPQTLDAMSAFERKVVHDALANFRGVATTSEGEEPNRKVVIRPR
jgi:spoIIIJ-associated protein